MQHFSGFQRLDPWSSDKPVAPRLALVIDLERFSYPYSAMRIASKVARAERDRHASFAFLESLHAKSAISFTSSLVHG